MSRRNDSDCIADILEAIKRIFFYSKDLDYDKFLNDQKTQDAIVRNLEVIGEASKNVSNNLRQSHPQVAWNDLAKVRDKLIHHYFGVNIDIVWSITKDSLPGLQEQLKDIQNQEKP